MLFETANIRLIHTFYVIENLEINLILGFYFTRRSEVMDNDAHMKILSVLGQLH